MKKRFAVFPGPVHGGKQGPVHHVGFYELCLLYAVRPDECVDMSSPGAAMGRSLAGLEELRPSYDGKYSRKEGA